MKNFDYSEIVEILNKKRKRREAWFIKKFYIEKKDRKTIEEEMYLNSKSHYYVLKHRTKKIIQDFYNINLYLQ